MILTTCAACAAPLAHDAPRCVRCKTIAAAYNYATSLLDLHRYAEGRSVLRRIIPVARSALGENNDIMLRMRRSYAEALYEADGATFDDLREAVTTLEDTARRTRQVLGGVHPDTVRVDTCLRKARAALRARETPPPR